MKIPRKYWTIENCRIEALKYDSRNEFNKNSKAAYSSSVKNKWLDDICIHMNTKSTKPHNYWTKENCHLEALKYKTRKDFYTNSPIAYTKARLCGWLSEITLHLEYKIKPSKYWIKERCGEEAKKYNSRIEFRNNSGGAYQTACRKGWIDEICQQMITKNRFSNKCVYLYKFSDNSVYVGITNDIQRRIKEHDKISSAVKKYINQTNLIPIIKTLTDYIDFSIAMKLEKFFVDNYKNNGWNVLNIAKTGALGSFHRWTKEECKKIVLKYDNYIDFVANDENAYSAIRRHHWQDELCSHLKSKNKPRNYWTKERCYIESLKYKNKKQFAINSGSAHNASERNNWLNEFYQNK